MEKILLIAVIVILTSCAVQSNAPSQNGWIPTQTGSSRSTEERLTTGVHYGSGQHTATLFADFECPACIRFAGSILPILESYADSGKLLIVYKQYPLTTIHKNAYRDALAAMCTNEQWKYMEYKKALYTLEEQKAGATVSDEDRISTAKSVGIDEAKMTSCLSSDKYKAIVDADIADGDALHIEGTPTLFFDGKKLDFSAFQDINQIKTFFDVRL